MSVQEITEIARQRDAEGLCRWCGSEAEVGHRHCAEHLAYYRRRQAERRKRLRAAGLCISCGQAPPCRCRSEEYRAYRRRYEAERRRRRAEDGVCTGCGGDLEDRTYRRCEFCRAQEHKKESAA